MAYQKNYCQAVHDSHPTAVKVVDQGKAYDIDGNEVTIDKTKFDAALATLDAKEYQDKRALEYPLIQEQLDMIYKAGQGGDAFQAAIKAVKDKYPKPE